VKYSTADTQILTKSQILKVAVSDVSGLESGSSRLNAYAPPPWQDRGRERLAFRGSGICPYLHAF